MDDNLEHLAKLKKELRTELKDVPGVKGFGIGDNVLRVYIQNEAVKELLPKEFHGVRIEFVLSGEVKKF